MATAAAPLLDHVRQYFQVLVPAVAVLVGPFAVLLSGRRSFGGGGESTVTTLRCLGQVLNSESGIVANWGHLNYSGPELFVELILQRLRSLNFHRWPGDSFSEV